jgi:hypothetical protein
LVSIYKTDPEKVTRYNDKLLVKLINPYNFPINCVDDYYFTIRNGCIIMYHEEGQYVAPYYKNEIEHVDKSVWDKIYGKCETLYTLLSHNKELRPKKYNYTNKIIPGATIPDLPEELEEPIPVYKVEEEYETPQSTDTEETDLSMYEMYDVDISTEDEEL